MIATSPGTAIELPRLRADQSEIARHPAKIKIVSMGRRWGKSTLGMVLSVATSNAGGYVAWVVPEYKNGWPLWRAAKSAVAASRSKAIRINETNRTIEFLRTGGFLGIFSADNADAMRGWAFNLVVLDEAARIGEDAWTDVIQPTLADADGDAILISTPHGRNWFWREYQRGLLGADEIASWTASSSANPSPQIQKAAALARTRVPEVTYRQEWLAEFVEDSATVFSPSWWANGQNRYDAEDPGLKRQVIGRWLSFDTAMKDKTDSDYAACTVGELTPDYRLLIREVWRDKLRFPDLLDAIERLAHAHNLDGKLRGVVIEDAMSGTSAYQTLTAGTSDPWLARMMVAYTPKGSKRHRASLAGVWAKNGAVWLPHPSTACPWLLSFEEELFSFTGMGESGTHDDMCLVAGTLIRTSRGDVPIENVQPGDYALTRQGYRRVLRAGLTASNAEVIRVRLTDGRELTGTANHRVMTEHGFMTIDRLRQGIMVLCHDERQSAKRLSGTGSRSTDTPMLNVATIGSTIKPTSAITSHRFTSTVRFGSLLTDLSLQVLSSITRMGIPITMPLTALTSNVSCGETTHGITQPSGGVMAWGRVLSPNSNISKLFAHLHQNGIGRSRGESGTARTVSRLGRNGSRLAASVNIVGQISRPTGVVPAVVRSLVTPSSTDKSCISRSRKPALNAEPPSWLTIGVKDASPTLAQTRVERVECRGCTSVYNLTVDDQHEYFANGILTHNCDSLSQLVLWLESTDKVLSTGYYARLAAVDRAAARVPA